MIVTLPDMAFAETPQLGAFQGSSVHASCYPDILLSVTTPSAESTRVTPMHPLQSPPGSLHVPSAESASVHNIYLQDHPEMIEHGDCPAPSPPPHDHLVNQAINLSCPISPCPLQGQGLCPSEVEHLAIDSLQGIRGASKKPFFPASNSLPKVPT